MFTKNTGTREILCNNGKEAVFPEIENGAAVDTVTLQPNSKVKLAEGWTVNAIWLKRHPLVTQFPIDAKLTAEVSVVAPAVDNKAKAVTQGGK